MTRQTLIETLTAYTDATSDPWNPGHQQRKAAATYALLTATEAAAEAGDRDAIRLWGALHAETMYAARNAASGDPMHRKVPEYGPIVAGELARLTADRDGIPTGAERAFCSECRTMRAIEDVDSHASYFHGQYEVEVTATHLACGHTESSPERIVGPSPGGEAAAEAMAGAATQARLARAAAWQETW